MIRIITLLYFVLLGAQIKSFAQNKLNLVGEARFLPGELIDQSIKDINGQVAAGIRVKTDLKGLAFEAANGIVKLNTKPGEYFLFVQPQERKIRILASEFIPLDLYLYSIGVQLKSGQTWEITVTGEKEIPEELSEILAIKKQQELDKQRRDDMERKARADALKKQADLIEQERIKLKQQEDARLLEEQQKIEAQKKYEKENKGLVVNASSYSLDQTIEKWNNLKNKGDSREVELRTLMQHALELALDTMPKDEFESQSDYQKRLKNNEIKRQAVKDEYDELIKKAWAPIREEMVELSKLTFTPDSVAIDLGPYDAEKKMYPSIKITAFVKRKETIQKENYIAKIIDELHYSSSIQLEPMIAKLFRQSEKILIHNIHHFVDNDGKQKLNPEVELREPIGSNSILINLNGRKVEKKYEKIGFTNKLGMEFVMIKPGQFKRKLNLLDDNDSDTAIVRITKPFYLGKYEVTQKQWKEVMRRNPSEFVEDSLPVENVSWKDVQLFISKLNELEGGEYYRLPTEAEWELAARAGSSTHWYFGEDDSDLEKNAWYSVNSENKTHPVGQKEPNAKGLYDMYGNVSEWVEDWYNSNYYKNSPENDPKGPINGTYKILRGGSWSNSSFEVNSHYRMFKSDLFRFKSYGFRLVRNE